MAQLDAFKLTEEVRKRLVDFSLDGNFVRDPALTEICRRLWSGAPEQGGLVGDLWVEAAAPARQSADTLGDLVNQGLFDGGLQDHLAARGKMPSDRRLYTHQREAILKARETQPDGARPALVITAGTGAGKTESFLLPVLDDLFTRPGGAHSGEEAGVKCIILYPMNALVNDQVERLYDWLREQEEVTLFHFTSETPESRREADKANLPRWEPCRMRTRQEARGLETHDGRRIDVSQTPRGKTPDILITNYSMLEYMLCRPQDAVFFGPALRALVLDEVHLYTGTLAAEITLLLRRLLQRCGRTPEEVLQLATSATIGTGAASELAEFAGRLFSKRQVLIDIIQGETQETVLPPAAPPANELTAHTMSEQQWLTAATQSADGQSLLADAAQCQDLCAALPLLVAPAAVAEAARQAKEQPAALLYHALSQAPLLQRAKAWLDEKKRWPLCSLAQACWGESGEAAQRATIALLQMGAAARLAAGAYPLLPHRLHVLARPTDGLVVCLNAQCSGDASFHWNGLGCVTAGYADHCPTCQSRTLALHRCANCGATALAAIEREGRLHPAPAGDFAHQAAHFTLQQVPGAALNVIDPATGERGGAGTSGLAVYALTDCLNCGETVETWRPFVTSAQLTLSILAETALTELPALPESNQLWLPARGRRMLAFSDSRQEAARLGPRLTMQHEFQLVRAALTRCAMKNPAADEQVLQRLRRGIQALQNELAEPGLSTAERQLLTDELAQKSEQLQAATVGGSLATWHKLVAQEAVLHELLNAETARKHLPDNWQKATKREWDANRQSLTERLPRLLGRELARTPLRRDVSLETLGLLEITYPGLHEVPLPPELAGVLPAAACAQLQTVWPDCLAALCDTLRTEGAVTLGASDEDDHLQFGGVFIGRWCAEEKQRGSRLLRFVGLQERQRRRRFAQAVLERCGLPTDQAAALASDMLRAAFRALLARAGQSLKWLKCEDQPTHESPVKSLQIYFPALGLRRPPQLYRCAKTGHVWPRSVLGCAPESADSSLLLVADETLDRDARIGRQRRELKGAHAFSLALWAEEHSAQLAAPENRRLQDLFKLGARNILSSTTTLELGIDIGGLNAVLMSNVPPGKANYLQRAGRAGRRADGSSIVLTYVRPRPFDREVFARFGDYLEREYRRPEIFLDRQRVVRRHSHAFFLGEFFRQVYPPGAQVGAMNAFGNMGRFCGVAFAPHWEPSSPKPALIPAQDDWQLSAELAWYQPEPTASGLVMHFLNYLAFLRTPQATEYQDVLRRLLRDTPLLDELQDWDGFLIGIATAFESAVQSWRAEYDNLLRVWQTLDAAGTAARPQAQANMLAYQMRALYEMTVIEALADRQFLPRYGFPIGTQKLRVIQPDAKHPQRVREEDQYRLERAGLLALREYVPGSQLLAGGRLLTSRGLLKHWTGAELDNYLGVRGSYAQCRNGHFYYEISQALGDCSLCGASAAHAPTQLLLPRHGFTTAAWDPPRLSADVERVGSVERATITFAKSAGHADLAADDFADMQGLSVRYREAGEILVYNRGAQDKGFAICLHCGYADSETKLAPGEWPHGFSTHARLTATQEHYRCWAKEAGSHLRNQTLAARETTDVLMLAFTGGLQAWAQEEAWLTTLGYALQIAGARLLELDSREIGVMIAAAGEFGAGLGVVLYDNVPGGAGHVRELFAQQRCWLEAAAAALFINEPHHARCETACLDCLLTFDAQEAMSRGLLQRRQTYLTWNAMLQGQSSEIPAPSRLPVLPTEFPSTSKAERLARGRARQRVASKEP